MSEMKITILNADGNDELLRASGAIISYITAGYADGSRPRQRHCAIFSNSKDRPVAVWGGPDHIRAQYERRVLSCLEMPNE